MPTPKFHRVGEAMAVDGDAPAAEVAPPDLDLDCYPYGFSPLLLALLAAGSRPDGSSERRRVSEGGVAPGCCVAAEPAPAKSVLR